MQVVLETERMLLRRFTEADAELLAALSGDPELGCRLYPAFWGRGLATEGVRALIESAFGPLHLDRVVATTMAAHTGSWRVLEKCGMRRVRTFYYPDADLMPGAEHGDFVYELTRSDA